MLFSPPMAESGETSAIDVVSGQRCLAIWEPYESARAEALRTERAWFNAFSDLSHTPHVLGWFDNPSEGLTILALSRCAGKPLRNVIVFDGIIRPVTGNIAQGWALSLIALLRFLATRIESIPDIALEHLVVTPENTLSLQRLIPLTTSEPSEYVQIRQIGQLLYLWTTGFPYNQNSPWERRAVRAVSPTISPALADLIHQLVEVTTPFLDLATLETYLREIEANTSPLHNTASPLRLTESISDLAFLAQQVGNHLAATIDRESVELTLYNGLAGSVMMLSDYVATFGNTAWHAPLASAAYRLATLPRRVPHPGGLYLGEAGIAFALVKAGDALEDAELVARGFALARTVTTLPHANADLLWGAAGRLRFLVWAWQRTGEADFLAAARSTQEWLFATTREECFWISALALEPAPYLGYGHGIAGIGDALLDLYAVTGDGALLEMIERIVNALRRTAEPSFGGAGLNWAQTVGDGVLLEQWCHGATGIGNFLIRILPLGIASDIERLVEGAVYTVTYGGAYLSPCVCHGVAGSIDLLLDYVEATGNTASWHHIDRVWTLLDDFRVVHPTGVTWRNHHLKEDNPSLMTGYGGVMACLLRLLQPARPRLLSLAGMGYTPQPLVQGSLNI